MSNFPYKLASFPYYLGAVKDILSRSMLYITIPNFLLGSAAYYALLQTRIINFLPWFSFPVFLCLYILYWIGAMVLERKIGIKGAYQWSNKQFAINDNPLMSEIKSLREEIKELKTDIKIMKKRVSRKVTR